VVNRADNKVSMYKIDQITGVLTPNTPATVATGSTPFYVTVDPSGRFAYVSNENDSTVTIYGLNSQGILSAVGTAPTGTTPATVAVVAR